MNILVVSQYFFPENFRVNDLVAAMVGRGHRVTVLTGQPNYPDGYFRAGYGWFGPRNEEIFGARVIRVPLVARGNSGALRLVLNYFSFAFFASLAARFRLRGEYDVVFVFGVSPVTVGLPAIVASKRYGAPVLYWILDLWPESLSATGAVRSARILKWVAGGVRWIYSRCARVLVQSKDFLPNLRHLGVDASIVKYFPNWIETEYERGIEPSARNGLRPPGSEFRIVYAGNIGAAQDFPAILEAAALVAERAPQVRWIIAGDGRMASWVKAEVARRGLERRFEFLGQLPAQSMPSLFASADALLVSLRPDPVFSLTVPGKVQSYLAAGRPVLAMLDGAGAHLVQESNGGVTCAAGDHVHLSQLIVELAASGYDELERMGRCGREYALREFGREKLFDRLEEWMTDVVAECKCRG